jgi:uncharacterized protein YukE
MHPVRVSQWPPNERRGKTPPAGAPKSSPDHATSSVAVDRQALRATPRRASEISKRTLGRGEDMATHGMDVDRMYSLASLLARLAQELSSARQQMAVAEAESSSWAGPGGEAFRRMLAQSTPQLQRLVTDLDLAARDLNQYINEQRSTSW